MMAILGRSLSRTPGFVHPKINRILGKNDAMTPDSYQKISRMNFFTPEFLKCLISINWTRKVGGDRALGGGVGRGCPGSSREITGYLSKRFAADKIAG
jgi:hypothetical protein